MQNLAKNIDSNLAHLLHEVSAVKVLLKEVVTVLKQLKKESEK